MTRVFILPVADKVPARGSYGSTPTKTKKPKIGPPATSTFPFESSVAVRCPRGVVMLPMTDQVPGDRRPHRCRYAWLRQEGVHGITHRSARSGVSERWRPSRIGAVT